MGNDFLDELNFNNKFVIITIILSIVISIAVVIIVHSSIGQVGELEEQREQLKEKHARLSEKADELKLLQKRLQTDPYLIQKLAREKLGLYRKNEKRIWIKKPGNVPDTFIAPSSSGDSPSIFNR